MTKYILIIYSLCFALNASAQEIKNEYIVTLNQGQVDKFINQVKNEGSRSITNTRILSKDLNIIEIKTIESSNKDLEKSLDNNPLVRSWGYNLKTQKRTTPNDEYFNNQWGLELINAVDAWDITTGGTDITGREIVIAVLDDGFDLEHPELDGRFLVNTGEIEDDGIDNDNNGYIDDYIGWNGQKQDDSHPFVDNHGVAVSGIIGANTDNELGVAGLNWKIKILPISGIGTVANVIASYQYVLDMRRLYNESNGEKGAYIVATNYSAGIDNTFPNTPNLMAWCDMYDKMGEEGILSAGATTNANRNVDEEGDIPTSCSSPYLIAVTNVDINDTKVVSAGYGIEHIDIGAPGRGTLALNVNGGYDQGFGGTSAATPHVTGAIGLLYSVPCTTLAEMTFTNPGQAALAIRDAIFSGSDANTTLEGITSTGGRLNIYNAIEELQEICTDLQLPGPLEITKIEQKNNDNITVSYISPDNESYNILITDRSGRTIYHEEFLPNAFGKKEIQVYIPNIITGIYFISIYNDNVISTEKLFTNK